MNGELLSIAGTLTIGFDALGVATTSETLKLIIQ